MAEIISVSASEAEVLGRMAEGRSFVWMSLVHPELAARIVADPENEIQWNGKIYGYRVFSRKWISSAYYYQLEIFERRSVYDQYLIEQAANAG